MSTIFTGILPTSLAAKQTLNQLELQGIAAEQINVIGSDDAFGHSFGIEKDSKAAEGGTIGAATGGIIGAVAAGLAAAGTIVIPGINLLIFGPLIAAAAGAGVGAAVGGLTGALIGLGIPEYEVKHFENQIKEGGVLLAVEARDDDQADRVKDIFEQQNALKIAA